MVRLVMIAALVWLAYIALRSARALSPAGRRKAARYGIVGVPIAALLWLVATGRVSWLFALLAPAWLLLGRAWRLLMMLATVRRLLGRVGIGQASGPARGGGAPRGAPGEREAAPGAATSEVEKAYAVLGLQPGAGREEILQAHKRLIQKMHPDKGGSDYLAATINSARDLLLKHTRH